MRGNTRYNVADPVNPQDVATKEYADKVGGGSPFFKENDNYKAIHTINMAYNKLLNLHKPTEPYDAATKDYVDYVAETLKERSLNTLKESLNKNPHIIAVHTHYYGPLIKDKYQFTFGESKKDPGLSGFLIPHSGRIKKIAAKLKKYHIWEKKIVGDYSDFSDRPNLLGSLFSFIITKGEDGTKTRLANYIGKKDRHIEINYEDVSENSREYYDIMYEVGKTYTIKYLFDNDFENYPVSDTYSY